MNAKRTTAATLAAILIAACLAAQSDSARASGGALLNTLDTPNPQYLSGFGSAVAAGDVNGDARADIVVGAPLENVGPSGGDQGRTYVFSDGGSLLYTLDTPDSQQDAAFGTSVATGDVNGDGKADVVVGASHETVDGDFWQGRAYAFSGQDGSLLYALDTPNPQEDAEFGSAIAAGDVNGDGKADIAVGAKAETVGGNDGQGRAYVFSGADGALLYTFTTANPQPNAFFGSSAAAGDIDGDGAADFIVGAYGETVNGVAGQGRAYTFSGADGSLLHTLAPPQGAGGRFGSAVAAGDVNGDAKADVVVGSPYGDAGGHVLIFSGADGSLLRTLGEPKPSTFVNFGNSVAAGDVNGDGTIDIIAGSSDARVAGHIDQGRAYAFSGTDGSLLLALTTPSQQPGVHFGSAVAAGPIAADGKTDLVVAAIRENVGGTTWQGRVYVFSGAVAADTDGDGCTDAWESLQVPATDPADPWDFYSVPVPALFAAPDPTVVFKDDVVGAGDAEAIFAYFKKGARTGTTEYEQDLNFNGVKDGIEYDRSVLGPGQSGPPDGAVTASDAQLAFAQFKLGYKCKF